MDIQKELKQITDWQMKHEISDDERFNFQEKDHIKFDQKLDRIQESVNNIQWLADISKATDLLKRPSLWLVALVLGVVALMGGVKALFAAIISIFIKK